MLYQCFDCRNIAQDKKWNQATQDEYPDNTAQLPRDFIPNRNTVLTVGEVESNSDLPAFVCPYCGAKPMADELIEIPEGPMVMLRCQTIVETDGKTIKYNYDLLTFNLGDEPWDYEFYYNSSDWNDSNCFYSKEAFDKTINPKTIKSFLRQNHPEVYELVKGKGLFMEAIWYKFDLLS